MKIMIIGSMTFAKEMLEVQQQLKALGHEVEVPCDAEKHVGDPTLKFDDVRDREHAIESNIMQKCFDLVAKSDAVLALNHAKNDIDGYVGVSTLMEIGVAASLHKKIFLLNPIQEGQSYRHELDILGAVFINGDLNKIID